MPVRIPGVPSVVRKLRPEGKGGMFLFNLKEITKGVKGSIQNVKDLFKSKNGTKRSSN